MNKDAEGRWKVGMSNIKLKMRVYVSAGVCGVALLCWMYIDPVTPIDRETSVIRDS